MKKNQKWRRDKRPGQRKKIDGGELELRNNYSLYKIKLAHSQPYYTSLLRKNDIFGRDNPRANIIKTYVIYLFKKNSIKKY